MFFSEASWTHQSPSTTEVSSFSVGVAAGGSHKGNIPASCFGSGKWRAVQMKTLREMLVRVRMDTGSGKLPCLKISPEHEDFFSPQYM